MNPFDKAPYLLPWYLQKQKPELHFKNKTLLWTYVEKLDGKFIGIIKLECDEKTLALFNAYTYVHASEDGNYFCVWKRAAEGADPRKIELYRVNDLTEINDVQSEMLKLNEKGDWNYLILAKPVAFVHFHIAGQAYREETVFPNEFKIFEDFYFTTDIPGLYSDPEPPWDRTNAAIIQISPGQNKVFVYPQDWYNLSEGFDKGYQWITRAARNPETGRIIGQGIRMNNFELDESRKNLGSYL